MTPSSKKIAITTGDVDGVGLEVAVEALSILGPQRRVTYFLFRDARAPEKILRKIDSKFTRITFPDFPSAEKYFHAEKVTRKTLFDIASRLAPPFWVEQAAKLCRENRLQGIVTGPMSKELIFACGMKDVGHTDILSRVAETRKVRMGFIGDKFNVVLATGHIPLKKVTSQLTLENVKLALIHGETLSRKLGLAKRPLALVGLNPHAGENGLIGSEEKFVLNKALVWARAKGIRVVGPLVPDAAFFMTNWKRFSVFISCYHDQGLIPFKMVHGQDSGCQVSLGLPFVRTSVDHGTAKDIFGQGVANPHSMISALQFCAKLIK